MAQCLETGAVDDRAVKGGLHRALIDFLYIGTGAEYPLTAAGQHHGADVPILLQAAEEIAQLGEHGEIEWIGRGAIDGHHQYMGVVLRHLRQQLLWLVAHVGIPLSSQGQAAQ